jgi:trigger factor
MTETKKIYTVKVKSLPKSEMEIKGSITAEAFDSYRSEAIKRIGKDATLPGFRKGKAPAEMIEKRVGETGVLEEMAELALSNVYPQIIEEHKIQAIGDPKVEITKIASGNPLEFTLTTAIMPEIKLGDYKKIAKKESSKEETIEVKDEEVEEIITEIKKRKAQEEATTDGKEKPETKGEKEELPELTDDFVKTLGDFTSVSDFKEKLKENIKKEKEIKANEARRATIIKKIVEDSKIDVPELLVQNEMRRMMEKFKHDLSHSQMTLEQYLERANTTEADIQKQWEKPAEERVKTQLVFEELIKKENISVPAEETDKEVDRIMQQYPQADREQARSYVENQLLTQKVFTFLESQK